MLVDGLARVQAGVTLVNTANLQDNVTEMISSRNVILSCFVTSTQLVSMLNAFELFYIDNVGQNFTDRNST